MSGIIRAASRELKRTILLGYFKMTGPPRILRFSSHVNRDILVMFGAKVGKERVRIYPPLTLHGFVKDYSNLEIGDDCLLGGNNYLDLSAGIILEEGVSLGPGVTIMTHNRYNYNRYLEEILDHTCGKQSVRVGRGSGIKAHALITMGVSIGEDVVVGGGAVVNRDVPDRHFVGGVPAKVIKTLEEPR